MHANSSRVYTRNAFPQVPDGYSPVRAGPNFGDREPAQNTSALDCRINAATQAARAAHHT